MASQVATERALLNILDRPERLTTLLRPTLPPGWEERIANADPADRKYLAVPAAAAAGQPPPEPRDPDSWATATSTPLQLQNFQYPTIEQHPQFFARPYGKDSLQFGDADAQNRIFSNSLNILRKSGNPDLSRAYAKYATDVFYKSGGVLSPATIAGTELNDLSWLDAPDLEALENTRQYAIADNAITVRAMKNAWQYQNPGALTGQERLEGYLYHYENEIRRYGVFPSWEERLTYFESDLDRFSEKETWDELRNYRGAIDSWDWGWEQKAAVRPDMFDQRGSTEAYWEQENVAGHYASNIWAMYKYGIDNPYHPETQIPRDNNFHPPEEWFEEQIEKVRQRRGVIEGELRAELDPVFSPEWHQRIAAAWASPTGNITPVPFDEQSLGSRIRLRAGGFLTEVFGKVVSPFFEYGVFRPADILVLYNPGTMLGRTLLGQNPLDFQEYWGRGHDLALFRKPRDPDDVQGDLEEIDEGYDTELERALKEQELERDSATTMAANYMWANLPEPEQTRILNSFLGNENAAKRSVYYSALISDPEMIASIEEGDQALRTEHEDYLEDLTLARDEEKAALLDITANEAVLNALDTWEVTFVNTYLFLGEVLFNWEDFGERWDTLTQDASFWDNIAEITKDISETVADYDASVAKRIGATGAEAVVIDLSVAMLADPLNLLFAPGKGFHAMKRFATVKGVNWVRTTRNGRMIENAAWRAASVRTTNPDFSRISASLPTHVHGMDEILRQKYVRLGREDRALDQELRILIKENEEAQKTYATIGDDAEAPGDDLREAILAQENREYRKKVQAIRDRRKAVRKEAEETFWQAVKDGWLPARWDRHAVSQGMSEALYKGVEKIMGSGLPAEKIGQALQTLLTKTLDVERFNLQGPAGYSMLIEAVYAYGANRPYHNNLILETIAKIDHVRNNPEISQELYPLLMDRGTYRDPEFFAEQLRSDEPVVESYQRIFRVGEEGAAETTVRERRAHPIGVRINNQQEHLEEIAFRRRLLDTVTYAVQGIDPGLEQMRQLIFGPGVRTGGKKKTKAAIEAEARAAREHWIQVRAGRRLNRNNTEDKAIWDAIEARQKAEWEDYIERRRMWGADRMLEAGPEWRAQERARRSQDRPPQGPEDPDTSQETLFGDQPGDQPGRAVANQTGLDYDKPPEGIGQSAWRDVLDQISRNPTGVGTKIGVVQLAEIAAHPTVRAAGLNVDAVRQGLMQVEADETIVAYRQRIADDLGMPGVLDPKNPPKEVEQPDLFRFREPNETNTQVVARSATGQIDLLRDSRSVADQTLNALKRPEWAKIRRAYLHHLITTDEYVLGSTNKWYARISEENLPELAQTFINSGYHEDIMTAVTEGNQAAIRRIKVWSHNTEHRDRYWNMLRETLTSKEKARISQMDTEYKKRYLEIDITNPVEEIPTEEYRKWVLTTEKGYRLEYSRKRRHAYKWDPGSQPGYTKIVDDAATVKPIRDEVLERPTKPKQTETPPEPPPTKPKQTEEPWVSPHHGPTPQPTEAFRRWQDIVNDADSALDYELEDIQELLDEGIDLVGDLDEAEALVREHGWPQDMLDEVNNLRKKLSEHIKKLKKGDEAKQKRRQQRERERQEREERQQQEEQRRQQEEPEKEEPEDTGILARAEAFGKSNAEVSKTALDNLIDQWLKDQGIKPSSQEGKILKRRAQLAALQELGKIENKRYLDDRALRQEFDAIRGSGDDPEEVIANLEEFKKKLPDEKHYMNDWVDQEIDLIYMDAYDEVEDVVDDAVDAVDDLDDTQKETELEDRRTPEEKHFDDTYDRAKALYNESKELRKVANWEEAVEALKQSRALFDSIKEGFTDRSVADNLIENIDKIIKDNQKKIPKKKTKKPPPKENLTEIGLQNAENALSRGEWRNAEVWLQKVRDRTRGEDLFPYKDRVDDLQRRIDEQVGKSTEDIKEAALKRDLENLGDTKIRVLKLAERARKFGHKTVDKHIERLKKLDAQIDEKQRELKRLQGKTETPAETTPDLATLKSYEYDDIDPRAARDALGDLRGPGVGALSGTDRRTPQQIRGDFWTDVREAKDLIDGKVGKPDTKAAWYKTRDYELYKAKKWVQMARETVRENSLPNHYNRVLDTYEKKIADEQKKAPGLTDEEAAQREAEVVSDDEFARGLKGGDLDTELDQRIKESRMEIGEGRVVGEDGLRYLFGRDAHTVNANGRRAYEHALNNIAGALKHADEAIDPNLIEQVRYFAKGLIARLEGDSNAPLYKEGKAPPPPKQETSPLNNNDVLRIVLEAKRLSGTYRPGDLDRAQRMLLEAQRRWEGTRDPKVEKRLDDLQWKVDDIIYYRAAEREGLIRFDPSRTSVRAQSSIPHIKRQIYRVNTHLFRGNIDDARTTLNKLIKYLERKNLDEDEINRVVGYLQDRVRGELPDIPARVKPRRRTPTYTSRSKHTNVRGKKLFGPAPANLIPKDPPLHWPSRELQRARPNQDFHETWYGIRNEILNLEEEMLLKVLHIGNPSESVKQVNIILDKMSNLLIEDPDFVDYLTDLVARIDITYKVSFEEAARIQDNLTKKRGYPPGGDPDAPQGLGSPQPKPKKKEPPPEDTGGGGAVDEGPFGPPQYHTGIKTARFTPGGTTADIHRATGHRTRQRSWFRRRHFREEPELPEDWESILDDLEAGLNDTVEPDRPVQPRDEFDEIVDQIGSDADDIAERVQELLDKQSIPPQLYRQKLQELQDIGRYETVGDVTPQMIALAASSKFIRSLGDIPLDRVAAIVHHHKLGQVGQDFTRTLRMNTVHKKFTRDDGSIFWASPITQIVQRSYDALKGAILGTVDWGAYRNPQYRQKIERYIREYKGTQYEEQLAMFLFEVIQQESMVIEDLTKRGMLLFASDSGQRQIHALIREGVIDETEYISVQDPPGSSFTSITLTRWFVALHDHEPIKRMYNELLDILGDRGMDILVREESTRADFIAETPQHVQELIQTGKLAPDQIQTYLRGEDPMDILPDEAPVAAMAMSPGMQTEQWSQEFFDRAERLAAGETIDEARFGLIRQTIGTELETVQDDLIYELRKGGLEAAAEQQTTGTGIRLVPANQKVFNRIIGNYINDIVDRVETLHGRVPLEIRQEITQTVWKSLEDIPDYSNDLPTWIATHIFRDELELAGVIDSNGTVLSRQGFWEVVEANAEDVTWEKIYGNDWQTTLENIGQNIPLGDRASVTAFVERYGPVPQIANASQTKSAINFFLDKNQLNELIADDITISDLPGRDTIDLGDITRRDAPSDQIDFANDINRRGVRYAMKKYLDDLNSYAGTGDDPITWPELVEMFDYYSTRSIKNLENSITSIAGSLEAVGLDVADLFIPNVIKERILDNPELYAGLERQMRSDELAWLMAQSGDREAGVRIDPLGLADLVPAYRSTVRSRLQRRRGPGFVSNPQPHINWWEQIWRSGDVEMWRWFTEGDVVDLRGVGALFTQSDSALKTPGLKRVLIESVSDPDRPESWMQIENRDGFLFEDNGKLYWGEKDGTKIRDWEGDEIDDIDGWTDDLDDDIEGEYLGELEEAAFLAPLTHRRHSPVKDIVLSDGRRLPKVTRSSQSFIREMMLQGEDRFLVNNLESPTWELNRIAAEDETADLVLHGERILAGLEFNRRQSIRWQQGRTPIESLRLEEQQQVTGVSGSRRLGRAIGGQPDPPTWWQGYAPRPTRDDITARHGEMPFSEALLGPSGADEIRRQGNHIPITLEGLLEEIKFIRNRGQYHARVRSRSDELISPEYPDPGWRSIYTRGSAMEDLMRAMAANLPTPVAADAPIDQVMDALREWKGFAQRDRVMVDDPNAENLMTVYEAQATMGNRTMVQVLVARALDDLNHQMVLSQSVADIPFMRAVGDVTPEEISQLMQRPDVISQYLEHDDVERLVLHQQFNDLESQMDDIVRARKLISDNEGLNPEWIHIRPEEMGLYQQGGLDLFAELRPTLEGLMSKYLTDETLKDVVWGHILRIWQKENSLLKEIVGPNETLQHNMLRANGYMDSFIDNYTDSHLEYRLERISDTTTRYVPDPTVNPRDISPVYKLNDILWDMDSKLEIGALKGMDEAKRAARTAYTPVLEPLDEIEMSNMLIGGLSAEQVNEIASLPEVRAARMSAKDVADSIVGNEFHQIRERMHQILQDIGLERPKHTITTEGVRSLEAPETLDAPEIGSLLDTQWTGPNVRPVEYLENLASKIIGKDDVFEEVRESINELIALYIVRDSPLREKAIMQLLEIYKIDISVEKQLRRVQGMVRDYVTDPTLSNSQVQDFIQGLYGEDFTDFVDGGQSFYGLRHNLEPADQYIRVMDKHATEWTEVSEEMMKLLEVLGAMTGTKGLGTTGPGGTQMIKDWGVLHPIWREFIFWNSSISKRAEGMDFFGSRFRRRFVPENTDFALGEPWEIAELQNKFEEVVSPAAITQARRDPREMLNFEQLMDSSVALRETPSGEIPFIQPEFRETGRQPKLETNLEEFLDEHQQRYGRRPPRPAINEEIPDHLDYRAVDEYDEYGDEIDVEEPGEVLPQQMQGTKKYRHPDEDDPEVYKYDPGGYQQPDNLVGQLGPQRDFVSPNWGGGRILNPDELPPQGQRFDPTDPDAPPPEEAEQLTIPEGLEEGTPDELVEGTREIPDIDDTARYMPTARTRPDYDPTFGIKNTGPMAGFGTSAFYHRRGPHPGMGGAGRAPGSGTGGGGGKGPRGRYPQSGLFDSGGQPEPPPNEYEELRQLYENRRQQEPPPEQPPPQYTDRGRPGMNYKMDYTGYQQQIKAMLRYGEASYIAALASTSKHRIVERIMNRFIKKVIVNDPVLSRIPGLVKRFRKGDQEWVDVDMTLLYGEPFTNQINTVVQNVRRVDKDELRKLFRNIEALIIKKPPGELGNLGTDVLYEIDGHGQKILESLGVLQTHINLAISPARLLIARGAFRRFIKGQLLEKKDLSPEAKKYLDDWDNQVKKDDLSEKNRDVEEETLPKDVQIGNPAEPTDAELEAELFQYGYGGDIEDFEGGRVISDDIEDLGSDLPPIPEEDIRKWASLWNTIMTSNNITKMGKVMRFLANIWVVNAVMKPATAITVAADEVISASNAFGAMYAIDTVADYAALVVDGIMRPFIKRADRAADSTNSTWASRRLQDAREHLTVQHRDFRRGLSRHDERKGWYTVSPEHPAYLDAARYVTGAAIRDPGFRAWLLGPEEFEKFWNDPWRSARFHDPEFVVRDPYEGWSKSRHETKEALQRYYEFILENDFLGDVPDKRKALWRKEIRAAAKRVNETGEFADLPDSILWDMGKVQAWVLDPGTRITSKGKFKSRYKGKTLDRIASNLFSTHTDLRRSRISRRAFDNEYKRQVELHTSQGRTIINLNDWDQVYREHYLVRKGTENLPNVTRDEFRQAFFGPSHSMVVGGQFSETAKALGYVTEQYIRGRADLYATQVVDKMTFAHHLASPAGNHLRAVAPFGRQYTDMAKRWIHLLGARDAIRSKKPVEEWGRLRKGVEGFLDTGLYPNRAARTLSKFAGTSLQSPDQEWDFSPYLFLPSKDTHLFETVIPGLGPAPLLAFDAIMAGDNVPREEMNKVQQFLDGMTGDIPAFQYDRGLVPRVLGGGVIRRLGDLSANVSRGASNRWPFEQGPLAFMQNGLRSWSRWMQDWDVNTRIPTRVTRYMKLLFYDLEDGNIVDIIRGAGQEGISQLDADVMFGVWAHEAYLQAADSETLTRSQRFLVPVRHDYGPGQDDLDDVWLMAAENEDLRDLFPVPPGMLEAYQEDKDNPDAALPLIEEMSDYFYNNMTQQERDIAVLRFPTLGANLVRSYRWADDAKDRSADVFGYAKYGVGALPSFRGVDGRELFYELRDNNWIVQKEREEMIRHLSHVTLRTEVRVLEDIYTLVFDNVNSYIRAHSPGTEPFNSEWQESDSLSEFGDRNLSWQVGIGLSQLTTPEGDQLLPHLEYLTGRAPQLLAQLEEGFTGAQLIQTLQELIKDIRLNPFFVGSEQEYLGETDIRERARAQALNYIRLTTPVDKPSQRQGPEWQAFNESLVYFPDKFVDVYQQVYLPLKRQLGPADPEVKKVEDALRNAYKFIAEFQMTQDVEAVGWRPVSEGQMALLWNQGFAHDLGPYPLDWIPPAPPPKTPQEMGGFKVEIWEVTDGNNIRVGNTPNLPGWLQRIMGEPQGSQDYNTPNIPVRLLGGGSPNRLYDPEGALFHETQLINFLSDKEEIYVVNDPRLPIEDPNADYAIAWLWADGQYFMARGEDGELIVDPNNDLYISGITSPDTNERIFGDG